MRSLVKIISALGFASISAFLSHSAAAKEITLGYVVASLEYPYNVATKRGFEDEAKKAGVKAIVLDPRGSVEAESNAIDDLIAQGVDGIGFLPLDSVVAQSWVDKISDHNIPAAAIALMVGDPKTRDLRTPYEKLSALVATDNTQAGFISGEISAKLLPKNRIAKIAIIEGAPGYAIVWQDTQGFKAALDKAGAKYEIVAAQPTDWTPEKGESVCQNFLTAHPDLDLIFSQADDMAIGCARAIHAAGSKTKLVATGGGSKLGADAIASGEIDGSVCTRPELLGRLLFKALYEHVQNPNAPKAQFVTYDMPALTKDTLAQCPPEW